MSKSNGLTPRQKHEIKHFTDMSHIWWGALTTTGQRRYDNKAKEMLKLSKLKKGAKILEIGCGDGEFTKRLIGLPYTVVGTDITPAVIEKANKSFKAKNMKFLVDDSENMQFKDNTFDLVCGVSILHHIALEKSLQEAYRVLKKGGQIFFTEPNKLNPQVYFSLNIQWIRDRLEYSPDETALIKWQVVNVLKKIGFRKVEVINYDFMHPLIPGFMTDMVQSISRSLEKTPLVKEISGSLIIHAVK